MANKIQVSIILPVYNCEKFISQAIQSVLNQTFENFELIIIDGASTDNTVEIIHKFRDPRIQIIRHRDNRGTCEARNTGIEMAKGSWIAPIDADDAWHTERLTKLLKIAQYYPDAFIGSDVMICLSGRNNELVPWRTFFEDRRLKTDYLFHPKPAEFVRYGLDVKPIFPREALQKHNVRFLSEFEYHEWLIFLLRLYAAGLKYVIVNEPLYYYRLRHDSQSTSYRSICSQLKGCTYLLSTDWIDQETRKFIKRGMKITRHRGLTLALQKKLWAKALKHAILSPLSIVYLLRVLPAWILRQREFRKLLRNKGNKG